MREFKIWMEGFSATGQQQEASLLGTYLAESFDDAVEEYKKKHPADVNTRNRFAPRNEQGVMPQLTVHSIWGCRLFDNESDARKSFG